MTYFHFLQLGLSMNKGLVDGGPFPKASYMWGWEWGDSAGSHRRQLRNPDEAGLWRPSPTLSGPQPPAPAGYKAGTTAGDHCWGPHQWPLPLTSFEIRNDTQLSKMYL